MTAQHTHDAYITNIKHKLAAYQQTHDVKEDWAIIRPELNMAAVAVILVKENADWHFVFIERAHNPKDMHSGQIAFPGGRVEHSDQTLIATALRESQEETGIICQDDAILGLMPLQTSRNGYQVRPIVAVCEWPQTLQIQTSEVASVFTIPTQWFLQEQNWDSATTLGFPENATVVYKPYKQHRVWGMTAKIVQQLLAII